MKTLISSLILITCFICAKSQTYKYYTIHNGSYYLVTASEGIEYQSNGNIVLHGTIKETQVVDPTGITPVSDASIPDCATEKAKKGQTTVCGPYKSEVRESLGVKVRVDMCENTNNRACRITIKDTSNNGDLIITYTES